MPTAATTAATTAAASPTTVEVGMNLSWFAREGASDQAIFINQLKGGWPFGSTGTPISYDENGYPLSKPESGYGVMQMIRRSPELNGIDPLTGTFRLYGEGDGQIGIKSSAGNMLQKMVNTSSLPTEMIDGKAHWYVDFDFKTQPDAVTWASLYLYKINPDDHIRDLSLVHHSHLDEFRDGQTFTPEFVNDVSGYDTLRYMTWTGATLYDNDKQWNATDPDGRYIGTEHHTYNTGGAGWNLGPVHTGSVPIEHVVELSNITDSNPWISLPIDMSLEQAKAWAQTVKAQLESGREVYFEYGNEVWNSAPGFESYQYAKTMAYKTFDGYTGAPLNAAAEWASYRGMQLYDAIAEVLGEDAPGVHYVAPGWAWQQMILTNGKISETGYMATYLKGVQGQKMDDAPSATLDRVTDYAVGLYYAGSLDEGTADEKLVKHLVGAYKTDAARADALGKWMTFGFDAEDRVELTKAALTKPVSNVTYSKDLDIGVAALVQADVAKGLDPLTGLSQVLRIEGNALQYKGVNSADWKTVMSFTGKPPSIAEMAADVQLVGYSYKVGSSYFSGFSTGLRAAFDIRVLGHVDYVKKLGLNFVAYEAGAHMQSPIKGAEGLYDAFAAGPGAAILKTWVEAAEKAGLDLYLQFSSHRVHADSAHSLGIRDYVGQPASEVPSDTWLKDKAGANEEKDRPGQDGDGDTPAVPLPPVDDAGLPDDQGGPTDAVKLVGGTAADVLAGGSGDDQIFGKAGDDVLRGNAGNDRMMGDAGNDLMMGGTGDDLLQGGLGNDTLLGDAGNDTLQGNEGDDLLDGKTGDDSISGKEGRDTLLGGAGNDTLNGGDGDDKIDGGTGSDLVLGGEGNDVIDGGAGDDNLYGDGGNDFIWGGAGNDNLYGGAGNDVLAGGAGDDRLTGGAGADVFVFTKGSGGGSDRITDFVIGQDRLQFSEDAEIAIRHSASGTTITYDDTDGEHSVFVSMVKVGWDSIDLIPG